MNCKTKEPEEVKNIYQCTCQMTPDLGDSTTVVQRIQYVYLLETNESPDCCNSTLSDKPGYKVVWDNEAPDHPTVWKNDDENNVEISAEEAQKLGCAMEDKVIAIIDFQKTPEAKSTYYPDINSKK